MSLSITGSSWVLADDGGAAEVVLDLNFREMTNQTLAAGVNTLSDGTACWVALTDSPPFHEIVNGQGLSVRCVTNDIVRVYFDVTGAVNAGKSVSDPGRYDPRDRIRIITEFSGTTFSGAGANGDGVFMGIYNGLEGQSGTGVFAGTLPSDVYNIAAIHKDSDNSNNLTPRCWANPPAAAVDYTAGLDRAVTTDHTWIVLETDNVGGSGWARYKTGSSPMEPYSTGLPPSSELTTVAHARSRASAAIAIASDNSPFTGSVMATAVWWAPVTAVSASLTRLAILRYGYVK